MEDNQSVSLIGVACHICAAAEGGPRYDKTMTPDERKGIENCIWMCQYHSRLIDTDTVTYTVGCLKQWKKDAEEAASKALANADFISEYYRNSGDNLSILQQMFDDMIVDGRFDELNRMLSQYKTTLSEVYEEFILRYRITYDVYCSRSSLRNHLDAYCLLPSKKWADELAKLFVAFHLKEELQTIVQFCTSDTVKAFCDLFISGELEKRMVVPVGATADFEVPAELGKTYSQFVVNHIQINKLIGLKTPDGNDYPLYTDEFYYRLIASTHNIAASTVFGGDDLEATVKGKDYTFLAENIEHIKLLDLSLQAFIWGGILSFLTIDYFRFSEIITHCPEEIRETPTIKRANFISQINHNPSEVNLDALLHYTEEAAEYVPLRLYLSSIDKSIATQFLNEHGYLYKKDSSFLQLKTSLSFENDVAAALEFLNAYRDLYQDDYTFRCLIVRFLPDGQVKNDNIVWLMEKKNEGLTAQNGLMLIRILRENQCWEELISLTELRLPNECRFHLAAYLGEGKMDKYVLAGQKVFQSLVDSGWKRRGLWYNLGVTHYHFGQIESAKKCFQTEYDSFNDRDSLNKLIGLRIETNDYTEDEYLENLKRCLDTQSQHCVGVVYMKRKNYVSARQYFLRSMFLGDDIQYSFNGYWQAASMVPQNKPETIKADTVCTLKSKECKISIAIHSPDILAGISSPTEFAMCSHYSVEDSYVSALLYHEVGDEVNFNGTSFLVHDISSTDETFLKYYFTTLQNRDDVLKISTTSADEFLETILPVLKSSSDALEKTIDEYNRAEIRYPLTSFASITGKRMLNALEYLLYGNKSKIRNNIATVDNGNNAPCFILSYDAILTLAHLNIQSDDLKQHRIMCAPQVKNQLVDDINEEIAIISDEKQRATMFYREGKVALSERSPDERRIRHSFLVRAKGLVNSIVVPEESLDYIPNNPEFPVSFSRFFANQKLLCESGSIALAKSTDNSVLVTDDQFLYGICSVEKLPTIGLIGFLIRIISDWKSLLDISKKLRQMNFANYLPLPLYKQIVDQLLEKDYEVESGSREIQTWLISDTESEPTEHHEEVISVLARDVYLSGEQDLNPDNILMKIVVGNMARRDPERLEKCISEAIETTKNEFEELF